MVRFRAGIRRKIGIADLGKNYEFTGSPTVFHRGNRGDAHVLNIWRGNELLYTVGGLIEACDTQVYYDRNDDILYICFSSAKEEVIDSEVEETFFHTTVTVEAPKADAVCTVFKENI